jgi:putative transposase
MAKTKYKELLKKILGDFIGQEDPVLAMLEWVAQQTMHIETETKVGAKKGEHSKKRQTYFSGTRVKVSFFMDRCFI